MDDEKAPPASQENVAVVFKLSDERMKAKKVAAKARREFIRERIKDRAGGQ